MRNIIRQFSGSIANVNTSKQLAIEIEEIMPPLPQDITEDFHGGGMPGPVAIPLGIQLSDASMKLVGWNVDMLKQVGLAPGKTSIFSLRGAAKSEVDEATHSILMGIEGRVTEPSPDAWTRGSLSGITYGISSIRYYKLVWDNETIHEISMTTGAQIVDGENQLREFNDALGF